MKNLIKSITVVSTLLLNSQLSIAANFGGVDITPTVFEVTLKKIEFKNTADTWVTFAQGDFTFDIASVNAGAGAGSFAQGASLPNGTYNGVRVTTNRSFGMTFSTNDAGFVQPCRTQTGNGSNDWATGGATGIVTNTGVGTTDGAVATKQQVALGGNPLVTTALANFGMIGTATELSFESVLASPFTIDSNTSLPAIQINFDVANTAEAMTTGAGSYRVFPQPPKIYLDI
ncbi:hypothetical protein CRYPA_213 [uncultured Candidatus Thioglobus sp.]|nr:hypothetical protein CRYPA_213 [uncultured Candidatus Thioglobus sp.]